MIKVRKYIILSLLSIILTIPIFFGIFIENFIIKKLNCYEIAIFIIGILTLLFLGKIIEKFAYNNNNVKILREQDVINGFINRNNRIILLFFFPIIIEELIFRYYTIAILFSLLNLESISVIFISSLCFSLFHIHIWLRYRNSTIFLIYLGYSFLLGLYNGYLFLRLGVIPCILIHYFLSLYLYYGIYQRYFK